MRNKLLLLSFLLSSLATLPSFAAQPQFVIIANLSTYPFVVKSFTVDGKPCAACATTMAPQSSSSLIPTGSNAAKLLMVATRAGGVEMTLKSDDHETEVTYANNADDDKIKIATKDRITGDFSSDQSPTSPMFLLIYVYDKPKN